MKKCNAIALFKKTTFPRIELINFTVNTSDGNIIQYPALYGEYFDFNSMYKDLLQTIKAGGRYVKAWTEFDTTCHDIMFVNIENPGKTEHYYCNAEV